MPWRNAQSAAAAASYSNTLWSSAGAILCGWSLPLSATITQTAVTSGWTKIPQTERWLRRGHPPRRKSSHCRVSADFTVATNGARLLEKMGNSLTVHTVDARHRGPLYRISDGVAERFVDRPASPASQLTTISNACRATYRQGVPLQTNNEE